MKIFFFFISCFYIYLFHKEYKENYIYWIKNKNPNSQTYIQVIIMNCIFSILTYLNLLKYILNWKKNL